MRSEDESVSGMGGRCGSLSVQSGSEPFGLWGVTNGIRADLRGHGRVRARGADMGFIARVGSAERTAWHMCRHWAHGRVC